MAFAIKVNGNIHSVDVYADTPPLWVPRDVLGMTGTKFGCCMALCGACTVHIDGVESRSCITPIEGVGSSNVTTIEAIGATAGWRQDPESLARPRGCPMRLLPVGADHVCRGVAGEQPASERFLHRRRHVRQHLSLRDLCAHPRSNSSMPLNRPNKEANHEPRSNSVPDGRKQVVDFGEQRLPTRHSCACRCRTCRAAAANHLIRPN